MKSRKKLRPSDDEIEADVLAKRRDASAWEVLPAVPPSSSPRPAWMLRNKHLELAAEFHVLSVLHQLGFAANRTLAQSDGAADIAVIDEGGRAITIDVKIVEGKQEWLVDRFSARKHHYVVVVAFSSGDENFPVQPQAYVVASEKLRKYIARRKLTRVSLEMFSDDLAASEAWQLITTEKAA